VYNKTMSNCIYCKNKLTVPAWKLCQRKECIREMERNKKAKQKAK
jgi:hypothetical protein